MSNGMPSGIYREGINGIGPARVQKRAAWMRIGVVLVDSPEHMMHVDIDINELAEFFVKAFELVLIFSTFCAVLGPHRDKNQPL
ncbi:hypothetical protein AWV80_22060 [Cupriavidus sp. UYMU48A]|nr:hypothetical protein AWV80_22060 [Cupriavidus sp. UYMU48A]